MPPPRIVAPTLPVFITRRTVCRFCLLRPDRELTEGFLYCLADAAAKVGIVLHAVCVMNTHIHPVVTDTGGVYPDFLHAVQAGEGVRGLRCARPEVGNERRRQEDVPRGS